MHFELESGCSGFQLRVVCRAVLGFLWWCNNENAIWFFFFLFKLALVRVLVNGKSRTVTDCNEICCSAMLINWMLTCNFFFYICSPGGSLCNCLVVYLIYSWGCLSVSYSGTVLPFFLFRALGYFLLFRRGVFFHLASFHATFFWCSASDDVSISELKCLLQLFCHRW